MIDGLYPYNAEGDGVRAYVVDTGIYLQHSEFEGRAKWGLDPWTSRARRRTLTATGRTSRAR